MSGLRTLAVALCGLLTAPACAQTSDTLQFFAACTGRLSAEMEIAWLMQDSQAAEEAEAQRAALIDLVGALISDEDGAQVLSWRINAKMAHAGLLTRAVFNDDPEDAKWAAATALRARAICTEMVLS